MNMQSGTSDVVARLRTAAEADTLPEKARQRAAQILGRLNAPVRIVLAGFPSSGKARLVNSLAGEAVLPEAAHLPTVSLSWGDRPASTLTMPDGLKLDFEGPIGGPEAAQAAFAQVRRPIEILRRINILNIVADANAAEQLAALRWAQPRTDIALWCTNGLEKLERSIWSNAPEEIKDHAYLVVNTNEPSDLPNAEDEDFRAVFPIGSEGRGADALIAEILKLADLGRQADIDAAQLFLNRYYSAPTAAQAQPATPALAEAASDFAPAPATAAHAAMPEGPDAVSPALRTVCETGFNLLRNTGRTLLSEQDIDASAVLEGCTETVTKLTDLIASEEDDGDPGLVAVGDMVMEAESQLVLLEIEADDAAAADAVTLLLQLRRDFETRIAA